MYENDSGVRSSLAANNLAAIQAIHGQRSPDLNEGPGGNDSFNFATQLQASDGRSEGSGGSSGGGSKTRGSTPGITSPLIAFGDITTVNDVDDFSWQILHGE